MVIGLCFSFWCIIERTYQQLKHLGLMITEIVLETNFMFVLVFECCHPISVSLVLFYVWGLLSLSCPLGFHRQVIIMLCRVIFIWACFLILTTKFCCVGVGWCKTLWSGRISSQCVSIECTLESYSSSSFHITYTFEE